VYVCRQVSENEAKNPSQTNVWPVKFLFDQIFFCLCEYWFKKIPDLAAQSLVFYFDAHFKKFFLLPPPRLSSSFLRRLTFPSFLCASSSLLHFLILLILLFLLFLLVYSTSLLFYSFCSFLFLSHLSTHTLDLLIPICWPLILTAK
jgi:hypothetical protein